METPYFEYIVVGLGGIGSGALYWLSKRVGKNVLGLEQFNLGHDNGGSQDHSRIIRNLYDDARYTKLTPKTYEAWAAVEEESGIQLVYKTGSLHISLPGSQHFTKKYRDAMLANNIKFDDLNSKEIQKRYPQFNLEPGTTGIYEKEGGLVCAAHGNAVHIQLARSHGARVLENCSVTRIQTNSDGTAMVHTTKGKFKCRRVIVTAGAWLNDILGSVGVHIPVTVTQEQVTYLATPYVKDFTKDRFPVFILQQENLGFYGIPIHGNTCFKIGIDAGGNPVTAHTRSFIPDPEREKICMDFLMKTIPKSVGPKSYSKTCLYTMTPDRHFVVDTLAGKGKPQVVICCGAGHAYKFASLLGKVLSELAIDGSTTSDISGFSLDREALHDPNFTPVFQNSIKKVSKL